MPIVQDGAKFPQSNVTLISSCVLTTHIYICVYDINTIDPTGHKWSWKSFTSAAVQGFISTVLPGPVGGAISGAIGAEMNGTSVKQGAIMEILH